MGKNVYDELDDYLTRAKRKSSSHVVAEAKTATLVEALSRNRNGTVPQGPAVATAVHTSRLAASSAANVRRLLASSRAAAKPRGLPVSVAFGRTTPADLHPAEPNRARRPVPGPSEDPSAFPDAPLGRRHASPGAGGAAVPRPAGGTKAARAARASLQEYDGASLSSFDSGSDSEAEWGGRGGKRDSRLTDPARGARTHSVGSFFRPSAPARGQVYTETTRRFLDDITNKKTTAQLAQEDAKRRAYLAPNHPYRAIDAGAAPRGVPAPPGAARSGPRPGSLLATKGVEPAAMMELRSALARPQLTASAAAAARPALAAAGAALSTAAPPTLPLPPAAASGPPSVLHQLTAPEPSPPSAPALPDYNAAIRDRIISVPDPKTIDPLEEVRSALNRWKDFGQTGTLLSDPASRRGAAASDEAPPAPLLDPSPVPLTAAALEAAALGGRGSASELANAAGLGIELQLRPSAVDSLAALHLARKIRERDLGVSDTATREEEEGDVHSGPTWPTPADLVYTGGGASLPQHAGTGSGAGGPGRAEVGSSGAAGAGRGDPSAAGPTPEATPLPLLPHAPPHEILSRAITLGIPGLMSGSERERSEALRQMLRHQRLVRPLVPLSAGVDSSMSAFAPRLFEAMSEPMGGVGMTPVGARGFIGGVAEDLPGRHWEGIRSILGLPHIGASDEEDAAGDAEPDRRRRRRRPSSHSRSRSPALPSSSREGSGRSHPHRSHRDSASRKLKSREGSPAPPQDHTPVLGPFLTLAPPLPHSGGQRSSGSATPAAPSLPRSCQSSAVGPSAGAEAPPSTATSAVISDRATPSYTPPPPPLPFPSFMVSTLPAPPNATQIAASTAAAAAGLVIPPPEVPPSPPRPARSSSGAPLGTLAAGRHLRVPSGEEGLAREVAADLLSAPVRSRNVVQDILERAGLDPAVILAAPGEAPVGSVVPQASSSEGGPGAAAAGDQGGAAGVSDGAALRLLYPELFSGSDVAATGGVQSEGSVGEAEAAVD